MLNSVVFIQVCSLLDENQTIMLSYFEYSLFVTCSFAHIQSKSFSHIVCVQYFCCHQSFLSLKTHFFFSTMPLSFLRTLPMVFISSLFICLRGPSTQFDLICILKSTVCNWNIFSVVHGIKRVKFSTHNLFACGDTKIIATVCFHAHFIGEIETVCFAHQCY